MVCGRRCRSVCPLSAASLPSRRAPVPLCQHVRRTLRQGLWHRQHQSACLAHRERLLGNAGGATTMLVPLAAFLFSPTASASLCHTC